MSDGWVKLWRKSMDSAVFQNPNLWMFWCWCLMKATHKRTQTIINYQLIDLEPGQFIFGRRRAETELPLTQRNLRTCLKNLEKLGNLTQKTTRKYTIITIINWNSYQQTETSSDPLYDPQTTHRRPTDDPPGDHIQEVKNEKNVQEEVKISSPQTTSDGPHIANCPHQEIINLYHEILPTLPKVRRWNGQREKNLRARWKEDLEFRTLERWREFFQQVSKRPFLLGHNDRGWTANLGWMVKTENFTKILEGLGAEREQKNNEVRWVPPEFREGAKDE